MNLIPDEVTANILLYLDINSLCKSQRISKKFWLLLDGLDKTFYLRYINVWDIKIMELHKYSKDWLVELEVGAVFKIFDSFEIKKCYCGNKTILGGIFCQLHEYKFQHYVEECETMIFNDDIEIAGLEVRYFDNKRDKEIDDGSERCVIRKIDSNEYITYHISRDHYFTRVESNKEIIYKHLYRMFSENLMIGYDKK